VLGVARDVTERKLAELAAERDRAALQHMTRVSTLGQLSASIAHQLNQPLAAILSNAEAARQLLAREPVDRAELAEICDDIVRSDHRAAEVIRRLGELFRRGELERKPVDVNELLRESLELARTDLSMRRVGLVTALEASLPPIQGGRVQLQQVFLNLIVNAADAMNDTKEEKRRLEVRAESVGPDVRISVRDSGTGIAPDDLKRLFDPFWSTKPDGMGMGLAVCRSITEAHQGTLIALNNPEGGATFCVTLPALAP
jgi:C4-dicarboxylate-specific signal transduction histidine kinase